MADATIVKKQWGYLVGGTGTDATTVTTGDLYIKRLILTTNDATDTITITDGAGGVLVDWIAAAEHGNTKVIEVGAKIKGIIVNPSATDSFVSIIVE